VIVAPRWAVYTGEVVSGRRITALPFVGGSWSIGSGASGSIEVSIPTSAAEFRVPVPVVTEGVTRWVPGTSLRRDLRVTTEPPRMFAAVLLGDQVLQAGPLWVREATPGRLTLRASGIGVVWDHRLLVSHLADWSVPGAVAASSLTWSGLSMGTIAKRIIAELLAHTGGTLPIVLPADETGTHTQTYPGAEVAFAAQRLSQLTDMENGPEIAFEPRLTADRQGIEWVMRTGTQADPTLHQTGLDWVIDASASRGRVGSLTVSEDASSMTLRALAKGAGSDTSTLLSVQASRPEMWEAGYPLLDSVRSYGSVTEQSTVDSHARADLDENDRPWLTWTVSILVSDMVGQMRPGDWVSVRVGDDHPLVEPGLHRARIATMGGQIGGRTVDLTMMPVEETT